MKKTGIRRNAPTSFNVAAFRQAIDHIDDYPSKIYWAAMFYAKSGIMVVPFKVSGNGGGYPEGLSQRHATCDIKKIDQWWNPSTGMYIGYSIAMAHGGKAGFCAVDVDNKKADGIKNLVDLQEMYGNYNDGEGDAFKTLMATTPSGGRHLIFRYHPEIISNSQMSVPGIDMRGGFKNDPSENGGITFVEPSVKPGSSGHYRWDDNHTEIIDMPQWLVDILCGRKPEIKKGLRLQDAYIQSAPGDHGEGRDRNIYMDLMRFAGAGYTESELWALAPEIVKRMDPPDEDMVRRKIESVIQSDAFARAKDEKKNKTIVDTMKLDRTDKGAIIRTAKNLNTILSSSIFEYEFGTVEYDDFFQRFTVNKKPLAMVADYSIGIQLWMSKKLGVDYSAQAIRSTIEYLAFVERPHSNAARDYMANCPMPVAPVEDNYWGSGRKGPGPNFEILCTEVLQLDEKLHSDYTPEMKKAYKGFLWFWLQGVAARACVPGCKMEIVLNLFGGQGIGKSTFFRSLCPDPQWFTDSIQDGIVASGRDNKDELSKLHAKLIVEMPELSPIKRGGKAADDKIKQFISAQWDDFRRAYGSDTVSHPRTCALCGTSNNNDIYRDITGARRFVSIDHGHVPIKVGDLDTGIMKKIRDGLWGEVINSFNKGELNKPADVLLVSIPKDLRDAQARINDSHRYEEIGISDILEWMEDKTRVTWGEIVEFARTIPGLRDSKEQTIMVMVRQILKNEDRFQFKRRITRSNPQGITEKVNCWVNTGMDIEKDHKAGQPVPTHWSFGVPLDKNSEY